MATALQRERVLGQIINAMGDLRRSLRNNAAGYKTAAQNQTMTVADIAAGLNGTAAGAMTCLNQLLAISNDATRKAAVVEALTRRGLAWADAVADYQELRPIAVALRDASKTTYAEIVSACDAVLVLPAADSLWPE
jgi:hypothetical protein